MTDQELFDFVVTSVMKQGRKSLSKKGNVCAYRGADGAKCAAGFLISDDEFDPRYNARDFWDTPWADNFPGQILLITRLQCCHDEAVEGPGFADDFWKRAQKVASEFSLTMPERPE